MILDCIIDIDPSDINNKKALQIKVAQKLNISSKLIQHVEIIKRSIDARSKAVKYHLVLKVYTQNDIPGSKAHSIEFPDVSKNKSVVIVGAGPAGLFAALKLIRLGIKPIIIERGKDVRTRRRDLAQMNKLGIVNPESNYCFGEGGAGTYSDGKLYTRATKRGDVQQILQLFVQFGATPEILIDTHPHIGTNKLPQIISDIRNQIIECGGEVHFDAKLTDIAIVENKIQNIEINFGNQRIDCSKIILATGHSARDIYELLNRKNILIEAKPFALGVRIEHPQDIIDNAQYHCEVRNENLPPASYSLVSQELGRGVFSFCMCPGGIIAPASTAPGELVVNGWSPSKRNNPFANSGTVVAVNEFDFAKHGFKGALAGLHYQKMVEEKCFQSTNGLLTAPAQRMTDFVNGKSSSTLPNCSYIPGIESINLQEILPKEIHQTLRNGILTFGKKMKGYFTEEANLVATESRTSSPVRIPRDKTTLEHPQIEGLFPCAEGAGYAGGIISAAIDGERCATAVFEKYFI
jgi:uncharacterized FAD-dependent dehydrogenase